MTVRKLLASGRGGRLEADVTPWNLHQGKTVTPGGGERQESDDDYSDDDSVDSKGSSITVIVLDNSTEKRIPLNKPRMPASPDDNVPEKQQTLSATNRVTPGTPCVFSLPPPKELRKTPPEELKKKRKAADDCHVLIRWSKLKDLATLHMACAKCGQAITKLERQTVGIATELDFRCLDQSEKQDFIQKGSRIDSYELNWRLILATQLIGELQVGGSIIALMLDISRDMYRNAWTPMEEALGLQQTKIGRRVANFNLKKETMEKVAIFVGGKAKYPVSVSYDMGWQKAAKTYDSLSGQGLMTGNQTKHVVAFLKVLLCLLPSQTED
jgi:hypothetical protein